MLRYAILGILCWNMQVFALDYKECVGTYGIDLPQTIVLIKSRITPENEQQINEELKAMEGEKELAAQVTFMLNAKSIEFIMDDGKNPAVKNVGVINNIEPTAEGGLEISTSQAGRPGEDTNFKLYLQEKRLVLESDKNPIVLIKK
jgi:hypothetical protein